MQVIKFLAFTMAISMCFSSCKKDDLEDVYQPESEGKGTISIRLRDNQGTKSAYIRNAGTEEERKINQVEFYVFDSNGIRDRDMYGYIKFDQADNEYTFPVLEGRNKTVLAVTNRGLGELSGVNLTEIKKILHTAEIENPLQVPAEGIPMTGEQGNVSITKDDMTTISMIVDRLYARFNAPTTSASVKVTLTSDDKEEITEWFGGTIAGNIHFTLNGYYVINGLKQSFVFPNYGVGEQDARWDTKVWTIGNQPANYFSTQYTADGHILKAYSGNSLLSNGEHVYLYENSPVYANGYQSNTIYAMIIEGTLYDSGNPANRVTRYWKIHITSTTEPENIYKILRNAIYKANISEIRTLGYSTPKEAEEEKPNVVKPPVIEPPVVEPPVVEPPVVNPGEGDTEVIVTVEMIDWKIYSEGVTP